ncbi:unnamed protein product [Notodromas monacha]|uniref:AAA+ ATPase domain-containing protein n=1 Tax=Notodromas monacha TaxID=399045 RepID=A0A7R9GCE6_9CRUS|nr:unnamed protein product [Notodromas monacha]CAG0915751.1 unnamed protein product [Notodromas monacha]
MDAFLKGVKSVKPVQSGSGEKKKSGPVPWVEKYRPRTVDDVAAQEEVVAVMKNTLAGGDMPNVLFYGPPGTGKTSTILAFARDLFGDLFHRRVLELNASDERGIQVVREKIKNFAQLTAGGKRSDGKPCPPFKLIILDEADSMTNAAQAALRRTMEKESKATRFCLICNYVSRIIAPITSRCAKFRFKPLGMDLVLDRLNFIAKEESMDCSRETGKRLHHVSEGDLRQAITLFQSLSKLKSGKAIEPSDVDEVSGTVPTQIVADFIAVCKRNSFEKMELSVEDLLSKGFSGYQFLIQLHDWVVTMNEHEFSCGLKATVTEKIAVVDHRLMAGGDEYLQLLDLGCVMIKALSKRD